MCHSILWICLIISIIMMFVDYIMSMEQNIKSIKDITDNFNTNNSAEEEETSNKKISLEDIQREQPFVSEIFKDMFVKPDTWNYSLVSYEDRHTEPPNKYNISQI